MLIWFGVLWCDRSIVRECSPLVVWCHVWSPHVHSTSRVPECPLAPCLLYCLDALVVSASKLAPPITNTLAGRPVLRGEWNPPARRHAGTADATRNGMHARPCIQTRVAFDFADAFAQQQQEFWHGFWPWTQQHQQRGHMRHWNLQKLPQAPPHLGRP